MNEQNTYIIQWWSEDSSLRARQILCNLIGWPKQYAEGEAGYEWLTHEQVEELKSVPLSLLDTADCRADDEIEIEVDE